MENGHELRALHLLSAIDSLYFPLIRFFFLQIAQWSLAVSKKDKYSVCGLRSTMLPIFWSECVLLVLALPEPVGGRAFGPRPPSTS